MGLMLGNCRCENIYVIDSTLEASQSELQKLGEKAREAYLAGVTKEMGFDDL